MIRALALSLSLLPLGGCISLLPKPPPPPRMYVLEAGDVAPVQGARTDVVLGVASPEGERTLLGSDLVWRTGDTIAFVAESQWSGRLEDGLQALIVDTISRQGRFRAAVPAGEATSDYTLRWTVQDFEIVEDSMQARFSADAIVLAPGRRIIATEHFNAESPVADRTSSAAAQALTRAAREGSARIGLFAADAVAQAEAARAAETSSESGVDQ